MAIRPYRFEVSEARSFKHPHFSNIQKHVFLAKASKLPKNIPDKANLREATGMSRTVYRDVRASLQGKEALPGTFDLLNLGITIIAEDVKAIEKRIFDVFIDDEYGIANGGHTAKLIWECQDDDTIAEGQHVEVRIITGVEGPDEHTLRVDIARAQNTGIAVRPESVLELDQAFQGIKDVIAPFVWSSNVAYKESDPQDIDVRELICAMEVMNVIDFPNRGGKYPISAYEKWSTPLKNFGTDFNSHRDNLTERKYAKLEQLLPEILHLYDLIRRDFLRVRGEIIGQKGAIPAYIEVAGSKSEDFEFPFGGLDPHNKRLTKGAAYPILGAFRNYVRINADTGRAEWDGGFEHVKSVWAAVAPDLFNDTHATVKEIGPAPNVLGKNRNHWASLYKTVENYHLREQLDRLTLSSETK